jgi:single-stranded-DNA-specific exonuclease
MKSEKGYVYIMANSRPTLYTGSTNNLARRVYEHKNNLIKGFTAKYNLHNLVYYECLDNVEQAIIRERQIKDLNRENKLILIKQFNPSLKDLYNDIIKDTDSGQARNTNVSGKPERAHPESVLAYVQKSKQKHMKKWKILSKLNTPKQTNDEIIKLLLENRNIKDKEEIEEFLNPQLKNITLDSVGIDKKQLKTAMTRIYKAIEKNEQIIVYGDYDVDGITGSAILWETLHSMKAKVLPYIPDRIEEGYGLSLKGIENLSSKIPDIKLIITVDNGIVAKEAVQFANKCGYDVIITDHHVTDAVLPDALAIVHTTKMCGAGVAWLFSKELKKSDDDPHLELAALGTIADLVPLTDANRAIVKFGLEKISRTPRPGLLKLFKTAGIEKEILGVYEIGYLIAPRLNAAGRIEKAMDSLRLLCTKDKTKAQNLAEKLELINRDRQLLTKQATEHASMTVKMQDSLKKIIIVSHESYQQGVIGLVAGKLVEEYYRPSIVISKGEKHSKASARSIDGFNIIEFLRLTPEYFVNLGGHPMAAGFTIVTEKITTLKQTLESSVEKILDEQTLTKTLKIDCEIPLETITKEFYSTLQQLAPFGMKNPEPVFATKNVTVKNIKVLGKDNKHLKLILGMDASKDFDAIAFGMGELARDLKIGDKINVAYNIDENTWNGKTKLQLKVRDIHSGYMM